MHYSLSQRRDAINKFENKILFTIMICRKAKYYTSLFLIVIQVLLAQDGSLKKCTEKTVSPDNNYECIVTVREDQSGSNRVSYRINYKNRPVVLESELKIELDNHLSEWALAVKDKPGADWTEGLVYKEAARNSKDAMWEPLYGERSKIADRYNETILKFQQKSNAHYKMNIEIRAYNEGIAFRYYFLDNPTGIYYRIIEENTEFTFAENTKAWFEPWAQAPLTLMPLKNWPAESERPLTLELDNGLYVCVTEAAQVDYVKTKFRLSKTKPNTVQTAMYESLDKVPYFGSPWRVVMAGETPGSLIENNSILLNLNDASKIKNTDWIKPGKIVRDLTLTEKNAKDWIDFAVKHNVQYVLFDWKWYGPAFTFDSDAGKVAIDLDLEKVISYGKERGVGIWLYVNQQALLKQDAEIFPLYKKWGIKGVKYGFVQVGSHRWTTWLHESVQRAADNELMVNIHDEFRLSGEQRTFPNIMTVEGIRGNEEMPDATHNATLPFTRGIAGAGDYTICYYNSRIKTTHAHQLALGVIMYSPLQTLYWYDNPKDYTGEPEIEFFDNLPTTWDDTKVLKGKIGEYIAIARRKGDEWFVGAIAGNEGKEIDLNFYFLSKNRSYSAKIYSDDPGFKSKTHVRTDTKKIKSNNSMHFSIPKSGGFAIWIK
ncbi:glycoside hydrolase family 97 protein [uncultured Flavobacterium sp.]|uniref:glycoside hydrolase family 97 protein n=1 Tax=uncultured Flavobacterium sp. TaxID=165435 RepID=UPI0025952207|nr:glycoside hydrolase family 97 protein [uncultured Flavobacterium sp.]